MKNVYLFENISRLSIIFFLSLSNKTTSYAQSGKSMDDDENSIQISEKRYDKAIKCILYCKDMINQRTINSKMQNTNSDTNKVEAKILIRSSTISIIM